MVQVTAYTGENQPTTPLQEKNYFCQWTLNNKTQDDKNCIIKQIKFDSDIKKSILLSNIKENKNNPFETSITNEKLKTENTWFFLRIKGYSFNLKSSNFTPLNIDILSTKDNKKYTTITPKFKIEKKQWTQKETNLVLVKYETSKNTNNNSSWSSNTKLSCNYANRDNDAQVSTITYVAYECDVYKLATQPTLATELISSLDLTDASKIDSVSDLQNDNYYIIYFHGIDSHWKKDTWLINLYSITVKQKDNLNQVIRQFTTINSIISKETISTSPSTLENLILLN